MQKTKELSDNKKFSEICSDWLSMERLIVKRSTYAKYTFTISNHILPVLGDMTLSDITSAQVNTFIYDKLTNGRLDASGPLSAKTVRDMYTVLKSVLKYAENEYQLGNLARNTVLPKRQSPKYEILTREEQALLEQFLLKDSTTHRKAGILLCLYTGLRLGEICALQWQDIDMEQGLLTIKHTLQRISVSDSESARKTCIIMDSPKSSTSLRTIPLTPWVITLLETLKENAPSDSYVLTNRSQYVEPRNYQYFFRRCLESVGLRPMNFHILRHTFASRCVESGFDVKTLSEILGHSGTEITLNYYVHSSMDNKRRQMELLSLQVPEASDACEAPQAFS